MFDIAAYLLLYFVICPAACSGQIFSNISDMSVRTSYIAVFQAGWFVESMWTQTLVIHMIRTVKLPFIHSHASVPVIAATFVGIAAVTAIPFTPLGAALGFGALPPIYFAWLAIIVICYMLMSTTLKNVYVKRYGEWL